MLTSSNIADRLNEINKLEFFYPKKKWYFAPLKKAIDIVLAFVLLLFSLPFFIIIAYVIKITSPGPVFFLQKRIGLCGRRFVMYKFRSMVSNAEQRRLELEAFNMIKGPAFKMREDPRVTKFGRLLRRSSLDELPQLWNVLRGEMSLVGPRPPIPSEVGKYQARQLGRLLVKPGLTCLWQISGRSRILDFDKWLKLDLEYVHDCCLSLDLKILLKTVPVVLSGFGAV